MMKTGVENRVALVTGCGSEGGIGFAIARALVQAGARVAITATTDRIHTRAADLGGVFAMPADLTDPAATARLFAAVTQALGPVQVLVNNAGMVQTGVRIKRARLEDLGDDAWAAHLALNVSTAFHCIRAALPAMQATGHGRIVNIASVIGVMGNAGQSNYAAAKAGMIGFSKSLAREIGSRNVTVNVVAPGFIVTDMTDALGEAQKTSLLAQVPLGRLGSPEDVAAAVAFLAGPEAAYITGETIHVNGGMYMI